MEEFNFRGYIEFGESGHFNTVYLTSGKALLKDKQDLVKKFSGIQELYGGKKVGVSFFISDTKETDTEIQEKYLKHILGAVEADYEDNTYYYSELTYDNSSYDTVLRIGGHDLMEELKPFEGKWCVLKVKLR